MQSRLRDLPYGAIMRAVDRFRKEFFLREWPSHAPSIEPDVNSDLVDSVLRDKHFEGVYLSYKYRGQILDMRRPEPGKMETHVRMNERGEFVAHYEYSRYEEKHKHINAVDLRWLDEEELWQLLE